MEFNVDDLHKTACKSWVTESNIQPPLVIGSKTTKGEITGISKHSPASFEIKAPDQDDSKGWSRQIIKFEDAVLGSN